MLHFSKKIHKIILGVKNTSLSLSFAVIGLLALGGEEAKAQYATGGTSIYRSSIFWVDWGTNGENVFTGRTITRGFNVGTPATAANRLDITCTLSGATSTGANTISVYTPGTWQGDGLDELYNIGGNQPGAGANPNTLSIGLATPNGTTIGFDFACSATLGGAPFTLPGLVFADAENSGGAEYVGIRVPTATTVRIIDQISQCGVNSGVTVIAGATKEIRFGAGAAGSCENNATPGLRAGPDLVGYVEGVTSGRVVASGGGISAVAVGVFLEIDYSEAIPATYGIAAHVLPFTWTGGLAATGTNYNTVPANLATRQYPAPKLGSIVLPDANATGAIGSADVDALPKVAGPLGAGYANVPSPKPGTTYTIGTVACTGPAQIAGWIDFNGNGVFDASEKSNVATCPTGLSSVALTWTVPTVAGGFLAQPSTYMRLRAASLAASIASASGSAPNGEVEDYRLALPAFITVTKTTLGSGASGVGGPFAFAATNTTDSFSNVTTVAANTAVSAGTVTLTTVNTATVITETLPNANWLLTAANCIDANAANSGNPVNTNLATFDPAALTVSIVAANIRSGAQITCSITNTAKPILTVTKTASQSPLVVDQVGQSYVVNIAVVNGPTTAAITIADVLPTGITTSGAITATGGTLSGCPAAGATSLAGCSIAAGAATGNIVIAVPVSVALTAANPSINSATVAGGGDPLCTGTAPACTGTVSTPVISSASVVIAKTDSKSLSSSGGTNAYVISITNQGPSPANGVIVTDAVGSGLTCPAANVVTCTVVAAGAVCPAGPFTVANLTGAGIAVATLPASGALQFAVTCNVN